MVHGPGEGPGSSFSGMPFTTAEQKKPFFSGLTNPRGTGTKKLFCTV